jgi:VWFA-related protein
MEPRVFIAASIIAGVSVAAMAQQPSQPTFRAGVEVVRLDVRVTDDAGRPVKDIQAHEIEILEDGKVRPIVLFQHIAEPGTPIAEAARRTMASEVSTNRGAPRGHLYVIVFDQSHITPGNEHRARLAAERFLRTHLRPGDRAALYGLPGPGPQVAFTGDVRRLIEALPRVRGGLARQTVGNLATMSIQEAYEVVRGNELVITRLATRAIEQVQATDVPAGPAATRRSAFIEERVVLTQLVKEDARTIVARANEDARRLFIMLADLMRELQGIEGRKSIILLSEGFYGDDVARELEQVAAAAARAYGVVYALDLGRRLGDISEAEPRGPEAALEPHDRTGPLGGLAAETDGLLFFDATPILDAAFRRIAEQSLDYYIVGFEPAAARNESRYRRVKVRVNRDGVRASARSGYALRATAPNPADRRRAINTALAAPFPQQGLPIEFTTYVLRGTSGGMQKIVMSLSADLPVAAADVRHADVIFVVRSLRDGRVAASGTDTLPLPAALRPGGTTGTGIYRVQFELPAGEYIMRAVVREPRGTVGSADRKFEVRPLDLRAVSASDLIFGGIEGGLPVRPAAHAGGTLGGVLELYARDAQTLQDVDVVVDLAPLGSRTFGASVRAALLDIKQHVDTCSRGATIQLPLDGIAPGEYVARARVTARGQLVVELAREIRVLAAALTSR